MSTPSLPSEVPSIQRGRVRFSPLQMDNIHTHFRWNNDPELNRLDSEVPHREEAFGDFKVRFENLCHSKSPTHRYFEIHSVEDETLIGVAYAARISEHNHHALVGVTIGDRDYWGRGYGKESLDLLLSYCFDELELHRVSAEAFEYNTAWRDLLEGMGFTREGVAREYLHRDGQYWDKEHYAILEHEYRTSEAADSNGEVSLEEGR